MYFIICPFVSCYSPNRSDRVFHCFWHCHGEDGRAGQVDGGILQHSEWNCNEVSDHDHVVSGSVLTSLWWGVRWSWGLQRTLDPPSRKEWAGMNQGKTSLERLWKRNANLFFETFHRKWAGKLYSLWARSYLPLVLCDLWVKNGFYVFILLEKKSRIVIFTTHGYAKFIFSAHK